MPAQVVSFLRRVRPVSRDWAQEELAEFYRVESALLQAGMRIETDRGVTDEGDPWFAFCRVDDGETFIHFARIDGRYIIAGPAYEGVAQGYDFPELVRDLISRHPLVQPNLQRRNNTNIFMHPAALLIAVVGTAFFKTADAKAAELGEDHKSEKRHIAGASPATVPAPVAPLMVGAGPASGAGLVVLDAAQTLTLVASAMAAMTPTEGHAAAGSILPPPIVETSDWSLPVAEEAHAAPVAVEHAAPPAASTAGARAILEAGSQHQVVVAAPNLTGDWLSLAAVLLDLPKPGAPQAADAISFALSLMPEAAHNTAAVEAALSNAQAAQAAAAAATAPVSAQAPAPASAEVKVVPPPPAAPAVLVVELNSASLPDIAAIRLVRDLGAGVTHDSIVKLDQLPDVLAKLIANGEHIDPMALPPGLTPMQLNPVDGASKDDPAKLPADAGAVPSKDAAHDSAVKGADDATSKPDTTSKTPGDTTSKDGDAAKDVLDNSSKAPSDSHASDVAAPPPADGGHIDSPPATVDVSAPVETIPTPPPAVVEPAAGGSIGISVTHVVMDAIISYFAAYAPIEVMMSGHGIVIYDTRIMTNSDALEKAESVTYTFDDGSTISLVGSGLTLHAAGALH
jgi:hypothetical protein